MIPEVGDVFNPDRNSAVQCRGLGGRKQVKKRHFSLDATGIWGLMREFGLFPLGETRKLGDSTQRRFPRLR